MKSTLAASESVSVFTGQRSVPQWTPALGGTADSTGAEGELAGDVELAALAVPAAEIAGEAVRVAAESELLHPVRARMRAKHRPPRMIVTLGIGSFSYDEGCRYFIPTAIPY